MEGTTTRSRLITAGLAVGAVILALLVAIVILDVTEARGNQSPIAGDPPLYDDIATAIVEGEAPYLDFPVEHLPLALVPMVVVEMMSPLSGASFETLWPLMMGGIFVITVLISGHVPLSYSTSRRYLLLSLPLLPLVLFRVELWLMLWVVAGVVFAYRSSWRTQAVVTFIGSLIKGWPVLLYALPFRLGRRNLAVASATMTVLALVGVAVLPGFREGRAFEGIHSETIVGNLLLVSRFLTGDDPQLIGVAGASYTAAGPLAVPINALFGLPFVALAAFEAFRGHTRPQLVALVGLGTLGIILASPLLSSQFVYWLVPFALFIPASHQRVFVLVSVTTLLTVVLWSPLAPAWSALVLLRNVALLALGIIWAKECLAIESDVAVLVASEDVA